MAHKLAAQRLKRVCAPQPERQRLRRGHAGVLQRRNLWQGERAHGDGQRDRVRGLQARKHPALALKAELHAALVNAGPRVARHVHGDEELQVAPRTRGASAQQQGVGVLSRTGLIRHGLLDARPAGLIHVDVGQAQNAAGRRTQRPASRSAQLAGNNLHVAQRHVAAHHQHEGLRLALRGSQRDARARVCRRQALVRFQLLDGIERPDAVLPPVDEQRGGRGRLAFSRTSGLPTEQQRGDRQHQRRFLNL